MSEQRFNTNPEYTGEPGQVGQWWLGWEQLYVGGAILIREYERHVGLIERSPAPWYWRLAIPKVVQDLWTALFYDPCHVFRDVPLGSRIPWRSWACMGEWVFTLSPDVQEQLLNDINVGRCQFWVPAAQDWFNRSCSRSTYGDIVYDNAYGVLAEDEDRYRLAKRLWNSAQLRWVQDPFVKNTRMPGGPWALDEAGSGGGEPDYSGTNSQPDTPAPSGADEASSGSTLGTLVKVTVVGGLTAAATFGLVMLATDSR